MPLPPKSAAVWLPRRTPGLAEPGPTSGAEKTGAGGGGGYGVGLLAIPGAPGSSRLPSRSGAALSGDTEHPAASPQTLRRCGAGFGSQTFPGQLRRRAQGLHEARQGAGQGRRLGPTPQPQPLRLHRVPHLLPRVPGRLEPAASLQSRPSAAASRTPLRSRLSGESHYCSGSARPGAGNAHTLAHAGWHRHNPPAGVTGALLPAAKKPALGTEHAPSLPQPRRSFQGRSPQLRSPEAAGGGNPFSLEPGEIWQKGYRGARTGPMEGVASDDLIPLNCHIGSFLSVRVDRNLVGLVYRNNTPMAGSLTQTK